MRFKSILACSVAALPISVLALESDAAACGGLFCSSANPVNQVAERIIFSQNADDTITAAIEIQYQGPARDFAWVLPVPAGDVEVGVSSKQALDGLQSASNPLYTLQTTFESCSVGGDEAQATSGAAPQSTAFAPGGPAGPAAVQVVSSGVTGPYDWVIIEVDDSLSDRADVAVDWLEENGFDIDGIGPDVLRTYLAQDMNLLAFKLTKGSNSGSIRPVMITYPGERPIIPIQPTAVAAQEDMGILVWVLGEGRAVPTNYLSLELNEARIDWLNPGPTYDDVVIEAADEAGGWGFVTEQSGDASQFGESIYQSFKDQQFDQLRTGQFGSLQDFLQQVIFFAQAPTFFNPLTGQSTPEFYDGFLDVMNDAEVLPLRDGASAEQFIACVSCYFQVDVAVRNDAYPPTPYVPGEDPIDSMNVTAFLDALDEAVVAPLERTRALFDEADKVTRLYTTLSPDEMTVDPEFDVNADLDDVSNVHTASRVMHCDGTSWTITLPQGHVIRGSGGNWPIAASDDELPFNARVLELSTRGEGEVILDNYDNITSALIDLGLGSVDPENPVAEERGTIEPGSDSKGSGGCSMRAPGHGSAAAALLGLALAFGMRRSLLRTSRSSRRRRRLGRARALGPQHPLCPDEAERHEREEQHAHQAHAGDITREIGLGCGRQQGQEQNSVRHPDDAHPERHPQRVLERHRDEDEQQQRHALCPAEPAQGRYAVHCIVSWRLSGLEGSKASALS